MLKPTDKVRYVRMADKNVVLMPSAHNDEHGDPVIDGLLAYLTADMPENPSNIRPIPQYLQYLLSRARELTDGVTVDLGTPLEPDA